MAILIIVRHGQSTWNLENRFTGNVDVELTPEGEAEARKAGLLLRSFHFNKAHTSVLKRAIQSLDILLKASGNAEVPIARSAALNERNYGELQGLNKAEVERKYGTEQLVLWRRSYSIVPPGGESLENTYNRVIPYYLNAVVPDLKPDQNVLIVAHGNSLRALMMYLEHITPEAIAKVNLETGVPRVYELDAMLAVTKCYYL